MRPTESTRAQISQDREPEENDVFFETQSSPDRAQNAAALAPEDFYYEGPNLVFTAAYHRKRGYCCNSGCRHCPFGEPSKGD